MAIRTILSLRSASAETLARVDITRDDLMEAARLLDFVAEAKKREELAA
jgi:hypothetical protein